MFLELTGEGLGEGRCHESRGDELSVLLTDGSLTYSLVSSVHSHPKVVTISVSCQTDPAPRCPKMSRDGPVA